MSAPTEESFLQGSQSHIVFDQAQIDEAAGGLSSYDVYEDDQYNNGPVTANSDQEVSVSASTSAAKAKKGGGGLQIVVTPALDDEQAPARGDAGKPAEREDSDSDPMDMRGKRKAAAASVDSTMNGVISWKKVADFSALLPKDVKLKLWNGVFKTPSDETAPEMKRISRVLRTFVMLHLTREYKKQDKTVSADLKKQLSVAVKEPSKFIQEFLKSDAQLVAQTLQGTYDKICSRLQTDDEAKKAKYAKKRETSRANYKQLTKEPLKADFNKADFLKTSFLQYMLYAYLIKQDTPQRRK